MQKNSHLVCGMFILVGAEKKIMGWRNMLGPGKKRWLTPAMDKSMGHEHGRKELDKEMGQGHATMGQGYGTKVWDKGMVQWYGTRQGQWYVTRAWAKGRS